jgi:hypothetical protein
MKVKCSFCFSVLSILLLGLMAGLLVGCGTLAAQEDVENPPEGAVAAGHAYPDKFPEVGEYRIVGIVNLYTNLGRVGKKQVEAFADVAEGGFVVRIVTMQTKQAQSSAYNWQTGAVVTGASSYREMDNLWGYIVPQLIQRVK